MVVGSFVVFGLVELGGVLALPGYVLVVQLAYVHVLL